MSGDPSSFLELMETTVGTDPAKKEKVEEFAGLMNRAAKQDEDCPEEDEDCNEMLSPCCRAKIKSVFGSLPLVIECTECKKKHLLADVVRGS